MVGVVTIRMMNQMTRSSVPATDLLFEGFLLKVQTVE